MSEVKRLTKADILQGNKNVYYEYFEKIEGELPLKSLTDGQASQIESVRSRGSRMNGTPVMGKDGNPDHEKSKMNLDVDLEIVTLADHEADCLAVFYGIADSDPWTVQDVKSLQPPGIVKDIADRIYKISGIQRRNKALSKAREKEVERFRDK